VACPEHKQTLPIAAMVAIGMLRLSLQNWREAEGNHSLAYYLRRNFTNAPTASQTNRTIIAISGCNVEWLQDDSLAAIFASSAQSCLRLDAFFSTRAKRFERIFDHRRRSLRDQAQDTESHEADLTRVGESSRKRRKEFI
jgi:hypothetical protein